MNKHYKLSAIVLSLAVSIGIASAAFAQQDFQGTITLGPNMVGQFSTQDLNLGDTVTLTLVNPTNEPLTFQTTDRLGTNMSWAVPANSQRVVSFEYTRPFGADVEYMVQDQHNLTISRGILFNVGDGVAVGENVFHRTITLRPGMGQVTFDNVNVGDTLMLTLINPTDTPLAFETTERLGTEQRVVIPPNSQRTIAYEYTQWFNNDVRYMVMEQPTGTVISQGVLVPAQQQAVRQQPPYVSPLPVHVAPAPPPARQTIRGYW